MVAGTLSEVLEKRFINYMPLFKNYLLMGLRTHQNSSLCSVSIGVVSDLCHSLCNDIAGYCDEFIVVLMEILQSNAIPRVKSEVLSVFGDIVLAIGCEFEKYVATILETLMNAVTTSLQTKTNSTQQNNFELTEYLNELWESILHAYTGIIQVLKDDQNQKCENMRKEVLNHIGCINQFLLFISDKCDELPEEIMTCAIGLIGDLTSVFGADMIAFCDHPQVQRMFSNGKKSKNNKTRSMVAFASREIKRVKNTQNSNNPTQLFPPQMPNTATASW